MRIDFSQAILGYDGQPLTDGTKPLTLGSVAVDALSATFPAEGGNDRPDGAEKQRRFRLALIAYAAKEADLPIEDVALIKKLVGIGYAPLVVGRVYELLEGTPIGAT